MAWDRGLKEQLSMEFQDKILKCIDCGADFVFTAGEQLFFHDKEFKNEPKRCKACKAKRISSPGTAPPRGFVPEWKPGPTVPAAARRPPSPSSQPKAGQFSVGSASSNGEPPPLPDLQPFDSARRRVRWTRGRSALGCSVLQTIDRRAFPILKVLFPMSVSAPSVCGGGAAIDDGQEAINFSHRYSHEVLGALGRFSPQLRQTEDHPVRHGFLLSSLLEVAL